MPVRRPRFTNDHISRPDAPRLLAFITYPARPGFDFEDLASLMRVPVGAATGEEGNMVGHDS